jgi:uncharacterized membrane protein
MCSSVDVKFALALLVQGLCLGLTPAARAAQPPKVSQSAAIDFQRDIKPIFQKSCGQCHGANMSMAQLRLDSEAAILKGGVSGPAIAPGKSGASLLVKRVLGTTDAPRMPMGGAPLPEAQVKLIQTWIDHSDFSLAKTTRAAANAGTVASVTASSSKKSPLFAEKIRPILAARCYQCHGPETQQNGLRLDSLAAILKGSESGKIITPGHSDQSRLIQRLTARERPQMPYGGPPLVDGQVKLIRQWIDDGGLECPTCAGQTFETLVLR